ncbi:MAG: phosphopantothenoylcysteine decarboxylase/phosphopantothenate--cysteine ligase [Porticoccus sp.]|jgi:phosphopantothenoylcysteine decarboxylase/phosphopantothenate--cysteine ligase
MFRLANKHIIVGISGGIAAYKAAELVRRLKDTGAAVRVVMTKAAQEFITPLTLQALSGNPVHTTLLDTKAEAAMGHIELARWADLILIAPCSADLMARLVSGTANDLLTTLILATSAPVAIAPAMNQAMWADPATQQNLTQLQQRHFHIFGPDSGDQACGDVGFGRMLEAEELRDLAANLFDSRALDGKRVVITAGPTREAIDPVRYISNNSSGKMGFALAQAAVEAGAKTVLIAGPVDLPTPANAQRIDVVSAEDMLAASMKAVSGADIFIATAAVADYRPVNCADQKIKKTASSTTKMTIELEQNPDIVATVAALSPKPFTVGFAAETQDVLSYAQAKLTSKKLDMIIANDVSDTDIGFNSDDNAVSVIWEHGQKEYPQMSKHQLARQLIDDIAKRLIANIKY